MSLPTIYRGSVKEVQGPFKARDGQDAFIFHFTDAYSVFDWGRMPDVLAAKGEALALLSAFFFEKVADPQAWKEFSKSEIAMSLRKGIPQIPNAVGPTAQTSLASLFNEVGERLQQSGLHHHYLGLVPEGAAPEAAVKLAELKTPTRKISVQALHVERPQERTVFGRGVMDYSSQSRAPLPRLIPLEVVFRYATPAGSSLIHRLRDNPAAWSELPVPRGFSAAQVFEGARFEFPILEFFTKLESTDRRLSLGEALSVSGITPEQIQELMLCTLWLAGFTKFLFGQAGIDLLDGKFEWALDARGEIMLVDAIGPDELRLEVGGTALSKEFLRSFYRATPWYTAIERAKKQAHDQGVADWKRLAQSHPESLPAPLRDIAAQIYTGLAEKLIGRKFWKDTLSFTDLTERLRAQSLHLASGSLASAKRGKSVLVIGSGGREHAIAWKLAQSQQVSRIVVAPGGDGMIGVERWACDLKAGRPAYEKLGQRARDEQIDLVVVGPDQALADGAVDVISKLGLKVFGPNQQAAQMESSKAFSKSVMEAAGVPTPRHRVFGDLGEAQRFLKSVPWPTSSSSAGGWVVKADGLALGKGVEVCIDLETAHAAAARLMAVSGSIVIEEKITGAEVSWMAFVEGERCSLLEPARDFKTIRENGQGPNTGGMGAYSPVMECFTPKLTEKVRTEVFIPVLRELKRRGIAYQGILYAGLMFDRERGSFQVLEFNSRFGDPEAQSLLPRFEGDLFTWMWATANGNLKDFPPIAPFLKQYSVYVVAASAGYPESPKIGAEIMSFEHWASPIRTALPKGFASGVLKRGTKWEVSGGRVLGALGLGDSLEQAREHAYGVMSAVRFEGMQVRQDIAGDA